MVLISLIIRDIHKGNNANKEGKKMENIATSIIFRCSAGLKYSIVTAENNVLLNGKYGKKSVRAC